MTNSLRSGTKSDIQRCVELGEAFHIEMDLEKRFAPYDPSSFSNTLQRLHDSDKGIFIVAEDGDNGVVGFIVGEVIPCYFNYEFLFSCEVVLYVDSAHRTGTIGRDLVKSFEDASYEEGADRHVMSTIGDILADGENRTEVFYRRLGYNEFEKMFTKEAR